MADQKQYNKRVSVTTSDFPNMLVQLKTLYALRRSGSQTSELSQTPPLDKFRRTARLVLACVSWCRICYERAEQAKSQVLSVTQMGDEPMTLDGTSLMFDPEYFKANKEQRISFDAKRILLTPTSKRTEKDLKYVQIALRRMQAFAEYPMTKQRKICEVGWYESFEPKRVIVRQGHKPRAFYIILSGTVVVTVRDDETQITRTVCFLHSGTEFGELSLINRSIRQATVVTKTAVELLCVSVEDYEEIFMSGGVQRNITDPDHNSFIRNLSFLKNFPIEKLATSPNDFMFTYFNRGRLLVRDSKYSEWIYIVKAGSLSIFKKLRNVEPKKQIPDGQSSSLNGHLGSLMDKEKHKKKIVRKRSLSWQATQRIQGDSVLTEPTYRSSVDMETTLERTLPGIFNKDDRLGLIDYDKILDQHRNRIQRRTSKILPSIQPSSASSPPEDYKNKLSSQEEDIHLADIRKSEKGVYFTTASPSGKKRGRLKSKSDSSSNKTLSSTTEKLEPLVIKNPSKSSKIEGRITITDVLEAKQPSSLALTTTDLNPTFIIARVLERGQYFGVSDLAFNNQPSLSLISNGADCFLLSKKFFLQHAHEDIITELRKTEIPYPPDEEMQRNLEANVNWEQQRAAIYRRKIGDLEHNIKRKKQFTSQLMGQYNFRTGPLK